MSEKNEPREALTARHKLLFNVRRSIRYHSRRIQFFDRYRMFTNAISVIFGSATIFAILSKAGPKWPVAAAGVVTVFSVVDLIVGSAKMARLHEDLYREFITLEKQIIAIPQEDFTQEDFNKFTTQRLDIEADEPPVLHVLNALCYNELARSMGYKDDEFVKVGWLQRRLAQILDLNDHKLKKYKDLAHA